MPRIVSDVYMPKLSGCFGLRRRAPRRATVASSCAAARSETSLGLTRRSRDRLDPNIIANWPSGMIAKLSCDWPSIEPFFSLTPTT